jgi:hypothetical protein
MFRKSSVVALVLALVPAVSIAQEQIKKGQQANINTYPDCTVVTGNLVNNCGFETGDFTGWTQGGDTSASGVQSCGHSGTYCAFMGPVFYNGTLTQSINTTGPTCSLSFWLANSGQPSRFSVEWQANKVEVLYFVPNLPYQQFSVSGLPGGGTAWLTFTFYNPPAFISLDDVVVTCP